MRDKDENQNKNNDWIGSNPKEKQPIIMFT